MKTPPRMTCGRFLQLLREESTYYEEIGRKRAIEAWYLGDELKLTYCLDGLSTRAVQRFHMSEPKHATDLMGTLLRAQIVIDGPKVFRPSLKHCLALEQIVPRLPVSEYVQPFPVMIVDPPESYRQLRTCPTNTQLFAGDHAPEFILVGLLPCDRRTLVVQVFFSSGNVVTVGVLPSDPTIEDSIVRHFGEDAYFEPERSPSPDERLIICGAARLGVNAMLLLMEYGCKSCGADSEDHYKRSLRRLKKAREQRRPTADAERELRMVTELFDLAQRIELHKEERVDHRDATGHSDAHRRPHWRRGYWKRHACGPQRSQRKWVLIEPVLVNKHLLEDSSVWHAETSYQLK